MPRGPEGEFDGAIDTPGRHRHEGTEGVDPGGDGGRLLKLIRRHLRPTRAIDWTPPRGAQVDVGLSVRVVGEGLPATVLVHGLCASGRYWGAVYDHLAGDAALVVPDLAGFGRSVTVDGAYGPDRHADLIVEALQRLGLDGQPMVVAAHSLGCLVAVHLARRYPSLVAGIVAFSPPLYANRSEARRRLSQADPLIRLLVASPALAEAVCGWMCAHPRAAVRLGRWLRPDLPTPLAEDRFRHTYRSYTETMNEVILAALSVDELHTLSVPVRLVAGGDDRIVDQVLLRRLAGAQPAVSMSVWPAAHHELPLTHPRYCLAEITAMRRRTANHPPGA